MILIVDREGRSAYSASYDAAARSISPCVLLDKGYLPGRLLPVIAFADEDSGHKGLIRLDNKLWGFVAQPILNSEGEGPIRGAVIMASKINTSEIVAYAGGKPDSVRLLEYTPELLSEEGFRLADKKKYFLKHGLKESYGRILLHDFFGVAVGVLEISISIGLANMGWIMFLTGLLVLAFSLLIFAAISLKRPAGLSESREEEILPGDIVHKEVVKDSVFLRPATIMALVGLLITVALFLFIQTEEKDEQQRIFTHQVDDALANLKERLAQIQFKIESVGRLFSSSDNVSRHEFESFSGPLLRDNSPLKWIKWLPRISEEQRTAFLASKSSELGLDIILQEALSEEDFQLLTHSGDSFPVSYVHPYTGNQRFIGLDETFEKKRRQASSRAGETGLTTSTLPVKLFSAHDKRLHFVIYVPVFRGGGVYGTVEARREKLIGFVAGTIDIDRLFGSLSRDDSLLSLAASAVDENNELKPFFRLTSWPAIGLRNEREITFCGHVWKLRFDATEKFFEETRSWKSLFAAGFGILLSIFLLTISLHQEYKLRTLRAIIQQADFSNMMREIRLRGRILVPVASVFILLLVLSFVTRIHFYDLHQGRETMNRLEKARAAWTNLLQEESFNLSELGSEFVAEPEFKDLLAKMTKPESQKKPIASLICGKSAGFCRSCFLLMRAARSFLHLIKMSRSSIRRFHELRLLPARTPGASSWIISGAFHCVV
jgi:CHASE1-domain containing sensor protein